MTLKIYGHHCFAMMSVSFIFGGILEGQCPWYNRLRLLLKLLPLQTLDCKVYCKFTVLNCLDTTSTGVTDT